MGALSQLSEPVQPSEALPQVNPSDAQVCGVQLQTHFCRKQVSGALHCVSLTHSTQSPSPLQTAPPMVQGLPELAAGLDGTPLVQTSDVHSMPSTGTSASSIWVVWPPLPSHTSSMQSCSVCCPAGRGVPTWLGLVVHWLLPSHTGSWHVPAGHWVWSLQRTQLSPPSQYKPPFSLQGSLSAWWVWPGTPLLQDSMVQYLASGSGRSLSNATVWMPP